MITTILFDFAQVLLFAKATAYQGSLSRMYSKLSGESSVWNNYELNQELMDFLKERKSDFQLAILTNSYTLPTHPEIQPELAAVFEEVFLASKLQNNKDQPACYFEVLEKLKAQPDITLFVDDTHRNVAAAKEARLHTIQYQNNEQLFNELKKYNIS